MAASELVVQEQRREEVGSDVVIRGDGEDVLTDSVDGDEYRDLVSELRRLQRAIMGEPDPF